MPAGSHPGQVPVRPGATERPPTGWAKQEIDYGRRVNDGYVFGAFQPTPGEARTASYTSRSTVNFIDSLD
jgi:hypothetical protein